MLSIAPRQRAGPSRVPACAQIKKNAPSESLLKTRVLRGTGLTGTRNKQFSRMALRSLAQNDQAPAHHVQAALTGLRVMSDHRASATTASSPGKPFSRSTARSSAPASPPPDSALRISVLPPGWNSNERIGPCREGETEVGFAADSLLEGAGFEPSVPRPDTDLSDADAP